jgi:hypothetical protein
MEQEPQTTQVSLEATLRNGIIQVRGLFIVPQITATSRFFYAFERSDGTSSDFIRKWIWNGNTGLLLNSIYTSNSGPIAAEFNTTLETTNKRTAIAYKQNDFARSYNGSTPSTDNIGNLPVGINQVRIGTNLSGHISQLTYYPTRLSNQVLQNLTK